MTVSPARIVSSTFWLSGPDQQNCLDSDPVQCLKVPYNLTYINLCHYIVYLLKTHAAFPPRFINALVSCLIIVSLYPFDEIDPCLISRFHCLVKSLQQSCEFDEMLHQSIRRRTVTHPVRVDCYHFFMFLFLTVAEGTERPGVGLSSTSHSTWNSQWRWTIPSRTTETNKTTSSSTGQHCSTTNFVVIIIHRFNF